MVDMVEEVATVDVQTRGRGSEPDRPNAESVDRINETKAKEATT